MFHIDTSFWGIRSWEWGQEGLKSSFFSEKGHAAYQIKENHECSRKVANTLPADSLDPGMELIGQNSTFSEHGHVAYQFKENHKMKQQGSKYFVRRPLPPPPDPRDGVSRSKFNFSRTWSCCIFI